MKLPYMHVVQIQIWALVKFLFFSNGEKNIVILYLHVNPNFPGNVVLSQCHLPAANSNVNFLQINTCNGFYCDYFSPNKAYKPKMWTEAWTGWYNEF